MHRAHLRFGKGFKVSIQNARSQAATMVLSPGDCEGGPDNRHRGSDQWLYVFSGTGEAVINTKKYKLSPGTLLLIERGDNHEIRNTGRTPMRTFNVYVPPAYTPSGEGLKRGRS